MATGVTVTDIVSEYGSYYINEGQNKSRVLRKLMQDLVTPQFMTQIKTDDTLYRLANGVINNLTQAFQKTFTAKGGTTFTAKPIEMFHIKVDDSVYPDDIVGTWLGFLEGMEENERKNWPLVRYLVEEYYMPQISSDIELKEIFAGNRVAPTNAVAGITGESMDGLRKLIIAGLNDGTMNHVLQATPTTSNIFDHVEAFVDSIGDVYKNVPMNIFMSPTWKRAYLRDKRAQGFYTIPGESGVNDGVDFTPQKVVGLPSMEGSNIFFATPKSNLIYITKRQSGFNNFKIEEYRREVSFMLDFWIGVGFGINEIVWVANANGSGSGSGA